MIGDISGATSIYIITGKIDMRKSINGLCAIVYDMMGQEINRNSIYLFCGTRCDRIKILLKEPDWITEQKSYVQRLYSILQHLNGLNT